MMRKTGALIASALLALLAACTAPKDVQPDRLTLEPVRFQDLPGWSQDAIAEAVPALARSCRRLSRLLPERPLGVAGTAGDWAAPCAALAALPAGDDIAARAFFESWFTPYAAGNNGDREGLFTGYYEPELRGARQPHPPYTVPIYRRPPDLVLVDLGEFRESLKGERIAGRVVDGRLRPFEDRAAITAGALDGKAEPLVWVDDPIAAFFLHIQGSGRVVLEDGSVLRVGYDGHNGHPYVAIGRELIARGELRREEVSLPAIRAWLEAHPDQAEALMNANASYIFFRLLDGEGPVGAEGLPLTPGRSLAVDRRYIPYGVPIWLEAEDPLDPRTPIRRLMVAQDTGGAIRGPVRGDVFWGHGLEAERRAGAMKSRGRYYLLLPRSLAPVS